MVRSIRRGWAGLAVALAVGAWGLLLAAALGTRWGLWDFRTGFWLLRVALWTGLAGAATALLAAILSPGRGRLWAAAALALGLLSAWVPYSWYATAQRVPAIHDISTDLTDPPAFEAVLPARLGSPNPAEYGGPALAEAQRRGYPEIQPLEWAQKPDAAFEKALSAAKALGWEIVSADPARGRIEATDTTFWFHFRDDVVVRVTPTSGGSRVDVRSLSRVGRSDVGTNARRIQRYLTKLREGG